MARRTLFFAWQVQTSRKLTNSLRLVCSTKLDILLAMAFLIASSIKEATRIFNTHGEPARTF